MYRERLAATQVQTDSARQLQQHLLAYHEFRHYRATHPLRDQAARVTRWQAQRLKATHQDLYRHPRYHSGLEFLLTDLYAPAAMSQRDDKIERVFPKMVKWLPDPLMETFAGLVELNLVTQQLDLTLAETLWELGEKPDHLTEETYCAAFRAADDLQRRYRQIALVAGVGRKLDHYVRNRTLGWLLAISRSPAQMGGLGDLHNFIQRGYTAFRAMEEVPWLIDQLVTREQQVVTRILEEHPAPFECPGDTAAGTGAPFRR